MGTENKKKNIITKVKDAVVNTVEKVGDKIEEKKDELKDKIESSSSEKSSSGGSSSSSVVSSSSDSSSSFSADKSSNYPKSGSKLKSVDEQGILDKVNSSKANWVERLQNGNKLTIPDWEDPDNTVASHRLGYATGDGGKVYVYPSVREIDGKLYDYTDPKNNRGEWDALRDSIKDGDYVEFPDEQSAEWYTENYKKYYDGTKKYTELGENQPVSASDSTPTDTQTTENVANNGVNTSSSENSEVNNFAVDKSENGQKNLKPGDVIDGKVYQGANADGTLNVSATDSPKMERRELGADGQLHTVTPDNSELYADSINSDSLNKTDTTDSGKVSFFNPDGVTKDGEQIPTESTETTDNANEYGADKSANYNSYKDGDIPKYGVSKNGDAYISDNPGVKMLQDNGYLNSDDLEEYLAGAPEAVSKEEEERIIKGMQTARSIGAFGALLSALANVIGTSKGAVSETIPEYKWFDYEALREKYRNGRNARAKYIAGYKDYKLNQELKRQKAELDRDKFETEKAYKQARTEYSFWQAKIKEIQAKYADGHGGILPKEDADLQNAQEKMAQAKERMEEAERHHRVMEGISYMNATTSRMNAETSKARANVYISRNGGGSGGSDITIVVPERTDENGNVVGGYHYNIPEKTYIKNLYTMAGKVGVPTTTTDDFGKTTRRDVNDISKEVIANWNGDCDAIIQNAIKGDVQQNKTVTPKAETKTETKTEQKAESKTESKEEKKAESKTESKEEKKEDAKTSSTSSGSVWGNSITRKKNQ